MAKNGLLLQCKVTGFRLYCWFRGASTKILFGGSVMTRKRGLALLIIVVGVVLNNVVYLQDLWFGQPFIALESWRAYLALFVSLAIIVAGLIMAARASD